jgi:hypothetical protein
VNELVALLRQVARLLLRQVRAARDASAVRADAGLLAGTGHVRVLDVTAVPRWQAWGLARRTAAEVAAADAQAPRIVVLAPPATAATFARAGLTVETPRTADQHRRALARYGSGRTVRIVPVAPGRPVAVAPVHVTVPPTAFEGEVPDTPLFVGGTGRSGTWALGGLLGQHPAMVTVHTELRFHAEQRAFSRLLDGSLSPDTYADEFLDRYYGLISPRDGTAKGLQLVVSRWEAKRAVAAFRRRAVQDLPAAMGALVHRLVDPYARARRAAGWVETTPRNAAVADALTAVLPRAHVLHIVRDGRDVAASMASMAWGPDDPVAALDLWAKGLRDSDASFRGADPARVHVVRFEDLVVRDRARTLGGLLDALGMHDRDRIERQFESKLDPARANIGRWRRDVGADVAAAVEARYRAVLDELADEGVGCLPVPPDELERDVAVTR